MDITPVTSEFVGPATAGEIAVLIPCRNEAVTIGRVVAAFRMALPQAALYVYDNASSDHTAQVAQTAGAIVRREIMVGKGRVVARMFADVEADVYILVDGDDTYSASAAPAMVNLLLDEQLDMVTGTRAATAESYRRGHRTGNAVLTYIVASVFGRRVSDVLSGYRVFSRRFVKSFPALADGFETETEFTIHALDLRMPIADLRVGYDVRPEGSASKLRTYRDGWIILRTIMLLVKEQRPLSFFGVVALVLVASGVALGAPVVSGFVETGLVPRLPTAVLATGLVLLGFLSLTCGFILDSVARGRREAKRLAYLAFPGVGARRTQFL